MGNWTIDFDRIYRMLDLLYGWLLRGPGGMDRQLLSLAAALLTGLTVMTVASRLRLSLSQSPSRALADYMTYVEEGNAQRNNPLVDKEAVILLALGLPVRKGLLTWIRLGAGGIPALLLLLFGFPVAPAAAGGGLVYMLTNAFLYGQWRKLRVKLEQELPTFVSRLAGALLVTNAPIKAIAEVADTLSEESPLHAWLQRLLAGTRLEGRRFLEGARAEAALISPSLALVVFQLGRLLETGGGAGFTRAFTTTAEELSAILEARAVAGAKAESARGAVFMMLGIMGVIMLLMLSSPNIRHGFQNPVVQVVTVLALTVMALGYAFLNSMIDEALRGKMTQAWLILAAAFVAGVTVYSVARRVNLTLSTSPGQLLAGYVSAQPPPDLVERFGTWLLRRFPTLTAIANLGRNRRWLGLEGVPPSPAAVLGLAALLALGGLGLTALTAVPATMLLAMLGFAYPFVRLRRQANGIRRKVLRALPELTALMAAEMAAGNPPDKALERASAWGGALAQLLREVLEASRTNNRPVFGRGESAGMLLEVVTRYDLPALRAFASQIDLAARKGAAGPELMESLARTLITEYKERALREAEALDNRLAVPAVVFFFLPFLFLLLAPLIVPLLKVL